MRNANQDPLSSMLGKSVVELGFEPAIHPKNTTTTQHGEMIDFDSDIADAGSDTSDIPTDSGTEFSSVPQSGGLLSKLQWKLGNNYHANPTAPSAPPLSMPGNSYLPSTTGAHGQGTNSYLSGHPTLSRSTSAFNANTSTAVNHTGFTPTYQDNAFSAMNQW